MAPKVIKKIDTSQIPKLGDDNYITWRLQVSLVLKAQDLWPVIDGTFQKPNVDPETWIEQDLQAMAVIVTLLDAKQINHVADAKSSKEMWDKLQNINSDASQYNKQLTQSKFFNYRIKSGQSITEAFSEIEGLTTRLRDIGVVLDESTVVAKIVSALPDNEYGSFKSAWDSVPDGDQTMTRLLARLKKEELALQQRNGSFESNEKDEKGEQNVAFKSYANSGGKKKGNHSGKGPNPTNQSKTKFKGKCHHCGKPGHMKKDCWGLKKEQEGQQGPSTSYQRSSGQNQGNNSQGRSDDPCTAFMTLPTKSDFERSDLLWWSDSGASRHYCGNMQWYVDYKAYKSPKAITLTDNKDVMAKGEGTVVLDAYMNGSWTKVRLMEVIFIPGGVNLFSEHVMAKKGFKVDKDMKKVEYFLNGKKGPEGVHHETGWVMKFRPLSVNEKAFSTRTNINEAKLWHERLGHINMKYLQETVKKDAVRGIDPECLKEKVNCEKCHYGKITRSTFPEASEYNYEIGEFLHTDLSGKIDTPSLGGANYFMIIKDDASAFRHVCYLKEKSEANKCMKTCIEFLERQTGRKVKRVRSDNGGEFVNNEMAKFYSERGIIHETSAPYSPESNGKIERDMRTLKESARTMLVSSKLPVNLWAEAIACAVYSLNRTLNSTATSKTAFEQVFNKKPYVGHMRVFGSTAYVQTPEEKRKVFDSKCKKMHLVGYDTTMLNYRLYDPEKKIIVRARSVQFDENADLINSIIYSSEGDEINQNDPDIPPKADEATEEKVEEVITDRSFEEDESNESYESMHNSSVESNGRRQAGGNSPNSSSNANMNTSTRSAREGLRDTSLLKKPERYRAHFTVHTPNSYADAIKSHERNKWQVAMNEEYESLIKHEVWEIVEAPADAKVLEPRWIFKVKENSEGKPEKYKARLVVKGYMQKFGVDYFETFASVSRFESVRLLLQVANVRKYYIEQFDVKTAYLYGPLDEVIYMQQAPGYHQGGENQVCLLKKSLYGLKQSGKNWRETLSKALKELGLEETNADPCVYHNKENTMYLAVYVDDGLVLGEKKDKVQGLLQRLSEKFDLTVSKPTSFIGMQLAITNKSILISQRPYIDKLLYRFGMQDCKVISTPMEINLNLEKDEDKQCDERIPYRELIGSLLFLARVSRPDITYAVNKMAQFNSAYNEKHFHHAKQILSYLKGTRNYVLQLAGMNLCLNGFTDSDWAGDTNDRHSTTGYAFFLGDGLINWVSEKQRVISLSSTEAEYISLSQGAKEAIWLRSFLEEIEIQDGTVPTNIFVDNTSAISLAKNPVFHKRSKHIQVRYHHIRELVSEGQINIEYVRTEDQKADILTKPLSKGKFERQRTMLGLVMLSILTVVNGVNFQEVSPVVWRETNNPVATGFDRVYLKIKLKSPCSMITNETFHQNLITPALKTCDDLYEEKITKQMVNFCPFKPNHHIVKREPITLTVLAVGAIVMSVIAVVGVATTSVVGLVKANQNEGHIEIMSQNLNVTGSKLNSLVNRHNDLVTEVERLSERIDGWMNFSTSMTYSLSYITTQLILGHNIIRAGAKDWRMGKVSEELFQFWNVSLPCNKDCPIHLGTPVSCSYMRDTGYWYLTFDVPLISHKETMMMADPFILMLKEEKRTCSIEYTGAKIGIRETIDGESCYQVNYGPKPEKEEIIIHLGNSCSNATANLPETNSSAFAVTWCHKEETNDHLSFVQIKHIGDLTMIYCPYSSIQIQGRNSPCPMFPFVVPTTTTFKLNGVQYTGRTTHMAVKGSAAMTMQANWALTPKLNLTAIRETTVHLEPMGNGNWETHAGWTWGLGAMMATVGAGSIIWMCRRCMTKGVRYQSERVVRAKRSVVGKTPKEKNSKEEEEIYEDDL